MELVSGSDALNQAGSYGTLGVASASNVPPARQSAVSWADASGNFWVFGGAQAPTANSDIFLNDLWEYTNGQWVWKSGSSSPNQQAIYGTLGVPSPNNVPGARAQAVGWADASGNLWLFGGVGYGTTPLTQLQNDLWKYSSGQWTWMGGSNTGDQSGIYGTQGQAAVTNVPGARSLATAVADSSGSFWLFGGGGFDVNGNIDYLNDLWKYSNGQWTWIGGANTIDQSGSYGTIGMASPTNVPSARWESTSWIDASGNFWLFGGATPPGNTLNLLNDLWKYSNGEWTWVGGSNAQRQSGIYGTQGTASASNVPGARVAAANWTDASGNFWLFGGDSEDSVGAVGYLNDLWKYSGGEWTWVDGSNIVNQPGVYGELGQFSASNVPGARFSASASISGGNLWLFGGSGQTTGTNFGVLNDLWTYVQ
jgi:N-acetylneuraminic acid mutarotase